MKLRRRSDLRSRRSEYAAVLRAIIFATGSALLPAALQMRAGTPQEPGFVDTFVENGLESPTSMAWAPDGSNRLFVALKTGSVRVVRNGVLQTAPFAKLSKVHTARECGLVGLCFDPDYISNRWIYLFVTISEAEQRIVRFTDVNSVGTARHIVVAHLPTAGGIHNGGALGFGHDGKLYWAIGDNGVKRGVDADLRTLASKVGRINSDGSIPEDNPFVEGAGKRNKRIWATGFRNPFSMTFQPRTGALWLNVVGSDAAGQTSPNSGPGYEQVFVVQRGDDAGYDDFEGNQPDGARYETPFTRRLAHPIIQYKTGRSDAGRERGIASILFDAVEGGARVVTTEPHLFRAGEAVLISRSGSFDGGRVVRRVVTSTELVVANDPTDAIANGGTIAPLEQGSCVVGGSFYEASGFPESFRGNFIYADYATGRLMRAMLDGTNRPREIRPFIMDARSPIDTAVGPDGALYYAEFATGSIRKVAWKNAEQALVVSPTVFHLAEGGTGGFAVRLRTAPAAETAVTIQRSSGDGGIVIASGETLSFTSANWDKPQWVTVAAGMDDDPNDGAAEFTVASSELVPQVVRVSVHDITAEAPIVSTNAIAVRAGEQASFDVRLPRPPRRPVTLTVRSSNPRNVEIMAGHVFVFTPENYALPRTVRIRASEAGAVATNLARLKIKARGFALRELTVTAAK
jgi:glucose/arabinose dehydrogenase